jgi:hypothetical protein
VTPDPLAYLVQYGRAGFLGCFALPRVSDTASDADGSPATDPVRTTDTHSARDTDGSRPPDLARGLRVVLRTVRGLEIGEVLARVDRPPVDGEIVRLAGTDDEAASARLDLGGQQLLATACEAAAAAGLPLAFVDVETTLDGHAFLHALPWDACDLTPLLNDLTSRSGFTVRLLDLSRLSTPTRRPDAPPPQGCGRTGSCSRGCSSGPCSTRSCSSGPCSTHGCSSGPCSRGSVASADELTAHFLALRQRIGRTRTTPGLPG